MCFGVFKLLFMLQAYSTVGTPDYIAPEVLLKKGYGMECDWSVYKTGFFFFFQICLYMQLRYC